MKRFGFLPGPPKISGHRQLLRPAEEGEALMVIENDYQALVLVLFLAITAPENKQKEYEELVRMALELSSRFDCVTVERAKKEAIKLVKKHKTR